MRRRLVGRVHISSGDDLQLSAADLLRHLSGARWRKLIGCGHAVVAATERAGQRSVIFTEVGSEPVAITGFASSARPVESCHRLPGAHERAEARSRKGGG